jgi:hypothetical protein
VIIEKTSMPEEIIPTLPPIILTEEIPSKFFLNNSICDRTVSNVAMLKKNVSCLIKNVTPFTY